VVAAESQQTQPPPQAGPQLELKVVARQTQEPICGVKLEIRIGQQKKELATDEQGRCRIEWDAATPDYLSITASSQGLVPTQLTWRPGEGGQAIPRDYTLAMERGTGIGGVIQDEEARPIEGVTVYLLAPQRSGDNSVERVAIWDRKEMTDKDGKWHCDIMPSVLDDVWIRLSHKDYISDETYGKTAKPPMEKLRDMTGVMVMKKGIMVIGRVMDGQGQPVEGAKVAQGSDRFGSNYPSVRTDKDGRFQFANARPGAMVLTVQARGFSPDLKQIAVQNGTGPIDFRLEPGRTLKGRLVDKAGTPVAGAMVAADTWRGNRSLEWRVNTDSQGRFQWDDAPADEVLIDMGKQGFMYIRHRGMTASQEEQVITLMPMLRVSGRIVDKATGQPIAKATILPGIDWGGGQPVSWDRCAAKPCTDGRYDITFIDPRAGHLVRIQADGYLPEDSRPISDGEGEVTLDFSLTRGTGPAGKVTWPDGQPAAGVSVTLATPSQGAYIRDGRNQQRQDSECVDTGADGGFSFAPQTDPFVLVFLHEKGYAEVSGEDPNALSKVVLQPWGRVQGRLMIGSKPGENVGINLTPQRPGDTGEAGSPRVSYDCRAVADKDGQFVVEHVPAGKAMVYRMIPMGDRGSRYSHATETEIKAGETTTLNVGGTGRAVIGRVVVPEPLKDKVDWEQADFNLRTVQPDGRSRYFTAVFKPDGSFIADDIPAGDYSLRISLFERTADRRSFQGAQLGSMSQSVTVPEMPGGRSDEPLDLGELELQLAGKAAIPASLIGKKLPGFESLGVTSPDSGGKPLLVCLVDLEQRPSRKCLSDLAKRGEVLSSKGITAVVIQTSKTDPKQYDDWLKTNQIGFPIRSVEADFETKKAAWGVKALPWLILTDKDRKVVAEGFAVSDIESVVGKVK
jgi:hypothetical protein